MITSYRIYVLMTMERDEFQEKVKRGRVKLAVYHVLRGRFVDVVYNKRKAVKLCRQLNYGTPKVLVTYWMPLVVPDWKLEEI